MAKKNIQSVEPNIAELANGWLKSYKLNYKLEQESLNPEIDKALEDYFTKNGGSGRNRPDAKLLLQDKKLNFIKLILNVLFHQLSNIFPDNIKFQINNTSNLYCMKICMFESIRDNSNLE